MRLTQNQKHLFKSGIYWAIYEGFTATFLIAFALALGASNTIVGIIGALPFVALVFSQILGAKFVEFYNRKSVYVLASGISRFVWLLIIAVPYFFKVQPLIFVSSFFFLIRFIEYIGDPAWLSIAADIVPEKKRGILFSSRRRFMAFALMMSSIFGGIYLDIFPKGNFTGFTTMFLIGIIFGIMSSAKFGRIKEVPYLDHKHHSLREFFILKGDLKKFCWVIIAFNFSVMLASPFFVAYMLKDLELSYTMFVAAGAIATVVRILSYKRFGRLSDRFGDKHITAIGMFGAALVPLSFIFVTKQTLWLIIPAQIISGIGWAAVDVGIFNLLLDFTDKKKRAMQFAEYATLTAIPMIIAPILGGLIADHLTIVLSGIPLVFAISFVLRFGSGMFLLKLKEPRSKKDYSLYYVLHRAVSVYPIKEMEHTLHVLARKIHK